MTSLEDFAKREASKKLAERVSGCSKILTIDIETSPTVVYTFSMCPNWISPDKIIEPSVVMCFAAKWYDQDKIIYFSDYVDGHEKMIQEAWKLLDEANIVVTFNGVSFDIKHLKREFALAGLPMPRPWKNVDLYKEAKKQWAFESKSLNHIAQRFELGAKLEHEGFDLWKQCLAGSPNAWSRMKKYNIQDVVLTEAVYDRMRGWIPTHPHIGNIDPEDVGLLCNQCGGDELESSGLRRAIVIDYRLYRCKKCGANIQGTWHSRAARTKGAQ